jgi:hypothetical protein
MCKVMVYRFEAYDQSARKMMRANRWALRRIVEQPHPLLPTGIGFVIEGSGVEIDDAILDGEGMTPIGFNPYADAASM